MRLQLLIATVLALTAPLDARVARVKLLPREPTNPPVPLPQGGSTVPQAGAGPTTHHDRGIKHAWEQDALQKRAPTLKIAIAIYKPSGENTANHWAIVLEDDTSATKDTIYQIYGSYPTFRWEPPVSTKASSSKSYIKTVPVGKVIEGKTKKDITKALKETEIIGYNPQWNCQDWATDGLRDLKIEGMLAQSEYKAARRLLDPQKAPKTKAAKKPAGGASDAPSTP